MPQEVQSLVHLGGNKVSQSQREGVRWERTEECRCRQSSIAGPLKAKERKLEPNWSLCSYSTWQKGISLLSLTLTHFHYTKHTGTDTDKWCNVKQSRWIKAGYSTGHPANLVMNPHQQKLVYGLQTFCNVLLQTVIWCVGFLQRIQFCGFCAYSCNNDHISHLVLIVLWFIQ